MFSLSTAQISQWTYTVLSFSQTNLITHFTFGAENLYCSTVVKKKWANLAQSHFNSIKARCRLAAVCVAAIPTLHHVVPKQS